MFTLLSSGPLVRSIQFLKSNQFTLYEVSKTPSLSCFINVLSALIVYRVFDSFFLCTKIVFSRNVPTLPKSTL